MMPSGPSKKTTIAHKQPTCFPLRCVASPHIQNRHTQLSTQIKKPITKHSSRRCILLEASNPAACLRRNPLLEYSSLLFMYAYTQIVTEIGRCNEKPACKQRAYRPANPTFFCFYDIVPLFRFISKR